MDNIHPSTEIATAPRADAKSPHTPLMPERTEFLEGDVPAAAKVEAFLANALAASGNSNIAAGALVAWMCDSLLSNHSVKAYSRDLTDFLRQMEAQGVTPLEVTADHVRLYKRAWLIRDTGVLRGARSRNSEEPSPVFGRCERTRRSPGTTAVAPARSPDAGGASSAAATRTPPRC